NLIDSYSYIEVPLSIENHELKAIVDSGAQVSVIDTKVVKKLGIKTEESKLQIGSCFENSSKSAKQTENLNCYCQNKPFSHCFMVKDFGKSFKYDVIIGLDIFAKLKLFVGGLVPFSNVVEEEENLLMEEVENNVAHDEAVVERIISKINGHLE